MKLKVFGKNAAIYSFGSLALRASAFLLIPLYTHYLSLSDFGILSILLLTIQILITLIDFGIINSLMRFLHEFEITGSINKLLGSSLVLNLLSSIVFGALGYFILMIYADSILQIENLQLYVLLTIGAASTQSLCVNMMSYYRANNFSMQYTAISLSITILLITFTGLFLVKYNMGIIGILLAQIVVYTSIWLFITIKVYVKEGFGFSTKVFVKLANYGFPLIFARSGDLMMLTLSTYLLGYFSSSEDVGIYSLAYRIASIAGIVLTMPFQLAFEPYIFSNINSLDLKKIISSLSTYLILAMAFISFSVVYLFKYFINLVAPLEYATAYFWIFFILPGLSMSGLHTIGQTLLHINNKTKTTGLVIGLLSIISMILSYFLIKSFNITGIIISFNFFQLATAVLLLYLGNKSFPVKFETTRIIIAIGCYIFLLLSVYFTSEFKIIYFYSFNLFLVIILIVVLLKSPFLTSEEKAKIFNVMSIVRNKFSRTKINYKK